MSFAEFVSDYGYLAVLVGSLLEGETILVLAGFLAHQGRLFLPAVLLVAFIGGTAGDQVFFWIGRAWGRLLMRRFPGFRRRADRVGELLRRYDAALIVGIRFMYGLRIAGPIAMGACGVAPWRFAAFNVLGAAIWAPAIGGAGYLFGEALQTLLGDLRRFENTLPLLIVGAGIVFALVRRGLQWRARALHRRVKAPPAPR
jgi:membrane protein DedA with SNARE-associated domain